MPEMRKVIVARDVRFLETKRNALGDDSEVRELLREDKNSDDEDVEPRSPPGLFDLVPEARSSQRRRQEPHTPELTVKRVAPNKRGRGRPRLLRTGSRGRPRKLFQTVSEDDPREEETPEVNPEEVEDDVFREETAAPEEIFAGVAEVSVREAMSSEVKEEWEEAILSEVESLVKKNTWDIVTKTDDQKLVGCRIVLTNKYGPDGTVAKRKARIVAKGYSQRFGVDYHHTFAPVARLESIRLVIALAAELGLTIWQLDVVTAFLNGHIDEEVFMQVPDMLVSSLEKLVSEKNATPEVKSRAEKMLEELRAGGNACRLNKALYGLRQAGRQWNIRLDAKLKAMGLTPTHGEPCLYQAHRGSDIVLLLIYVDDILVASQNLQWIAEIKQELAEEFEIKDLGRAERCLGLEIEQREDEITLSQRGYTLDILARFGMEQCNIVATPSEINGKFELSPDSKTESWPYRELIGALMYLAVATRPDIANTVSRLAQFNNEPKKQHWLAAKRVLRYLAGTSDLGLTYTKTNDHLYGFSDADWGGCAIDRRSYTGYVYLLGGAAVSWKSQKQRIVALSSTEAEYISMTEAAKEGIYLRSTLEELGQFHLSDVKLFIDNRGAECLASNHMYHQRTKHIDIRYHFIREAVANGLVTLEHVPTDQMVADIFTKPLPRVNHWNCIEGLGCTRDT